MALKCLLVSFLIKGQSVSFVEADSLFKNKNYELAATSYERIYFFSNNNTDRITALINRSTCFKNLNKNHEAYNSLVRILNYDVSDSIKCYANYQLALNLFLSNYYNDAEKYCAKNRSIPVNSVDYKHSVLLHGFVLNELKLYDKAKLKFIEYSEICNADSLSRTQLKNLVLSSYQNEKLPKLKSLKKARRLSKILPGAGLFYAGKPGKALANIGFQLFAVGYTGINIYFYNYVTSATAGLFLIRSFYTGGVNQLNDVIPEVNHKRSKKFNNNFKTAYFQLLKNENNH